MKKLLLLFLISIFLLCNCGKSNPELTGDIDYNVTVDEGDTCYIIGKVTFINSAKMKVNSGASIVFKNRDILEGKGVQPYYENGTLNFADNSYIEAKGTKEKIITIKPDEDVLGSGITLKEDCQGVKCIFEYCLIGENIGLNFYNSDTHIIRYCKIINCRIDLLNSNSALIEKNSIKNNYYSGLISTRYDTYSIRAIIRYNEFLNAEYGLHFYLLDVPFVEYNNIEDCRSYSISYNNINDTHVKLTIQNNYIIDCNSDTGVDTTGIQSWNVLYENPQTEPVEEAGCGW